MKGMEADGSKLVGIKPPMRPVRIRWMCGGNGAGPLGGHVKLPVDEELPGLAKHCGCVRRRALKQGSWEHQRLCSLLGLWNVEKKRLVWVQKSQAWSWR